MKKTTIVFTGFTVSAALLAFGKSIGAQFRNGHLHEGKAEPCDFVAGSPIPEAYSDVEIHPLWADFTDEVPDQLASQEPPKVEDGSHTGGEEVEITAEYLDKLTKKQMVELIEEEELEFTSEQMKNAESIRAALKEHYEV